MLKEKIIKLSKILLKISPAFAIAAIGSGWIAGEAEIPTCLKNELK